MFHVPAISADPVTFHAELRAQLDALLGDERDPIANLANAAALIWHTTPDLNWAGFYLRRSESELVLGPFQGKPACVRIAVGRGVCGAAVARDASVLVEDVHAFPGHIACDGASRSELVVPLRHNGKVVGVLDLDSPLLSRFTAADQEGFERLMTLIEQRTALDSVLQHVL
jgi:GAF domain-containing protein